METEPTNEVHPDDVLIEAPTWDRLAEVLGYSVRTLRDWRRDFPDEVPDGRNIGRWCAFINSRTGPESPNRVCRRTSPVPKIHQHVMEANHAQMLARFAAQDYGRPELNALLERQGGIIAEAVTELIDAIDRLADYKEGETQ